MARQEGSTEEDKKRTPQEWAIVRNTAAGRRSPRRKA